MNPDELMTLVKSRRSIRLYQGDPVPDEMVQKILEAGRWAPSASNRQPWTFVVVRDEAIRKAVAQHAGFFFVRWAHVDEAPLIIAMAGNARNRVYQYFLHQDIGLAGAQMMLMARALGLGSCWVGGVDHKAIGAILKLPENLELVGMLTIGFPAEDPPPPARKPLAEFVHYDVYGNKGPGQQVAAGRVATGVLGIALRRLKIPLRF